MKSALGWSQTVTTLDDDFPSIFANRAEKNTALLFLLSANRKPELRPKRVCIAHRYGNAWPATGRTRHIAEDGSSKFTNVSTIISIIVHYASNSLK